MNISNVTESRKPETPAKVYRYRCVEKCTRDGRFHREGEIIFLPEEKKVPHFEPVENKE